MSRWLRRVLIVAPLLGIAAAVTCVATEPTWRPWRARARGVQKLARAGSSAELKEAAGPLGVVLVLPGRDWVAIHYEDSHFVYSPWSQAVALDSEGSWYESQTHFCGNLPGADRDREVRRKSLEEERRSRPEDWPPKPGEGWLVIHYHLLAIQEAKDLEAAREHLGALGFRRLNVAEVPRLRGKLAEQ